MSQTWNVCGQKGINRSRIEIKYNVCARARSICHASWFVKNKACRMIRGNIAKFSTWPRHKLALQRQSLENEFYTVLVPWFAFIASLSKFRGKTCNVFRFGIAVSRSAMESSFISDSLHRSWRFAREQLPGIFFLLDENIKNCVLKNAVENVSLTVRNT